MLFQTTAEYTFFGAQVGQVIKTDQRLGHKFQISKGWNTRSMFSDHNAIKREVNAKKILCLEIKKPTCE